MHLVRFLSRANELCRDREMVLLEKLSRYSLMGEHALLQLQGLAQDVLRRNIAGDFVECGVFNGGSVAAVSRMLRYGKQRFWLYDSFRPLPDPSKEDGPLAKSHFGGICGSPELVREAMRLAEFPLDRCEIREGWYADTFRLALPDDVAFLHIDCDWFDSVTLTLETFYDRVSEGGIVVSDDFGHWEGCRTAYYNFVCKRQLAPLLERYGHTRAYWVKGALHNRDNVSGFEI